MLVLIAQADDCASKGSNFTARPPLAGWPLLGVWAIGNEGVRAYFIFLLSPF